MNEKPQSRIAIVLMAVALGGALVGFTAGLQAGADSGQTGVASADDSAWVSCDVWANESGAIEYVCFTSGEVDLHINDDKNQTAESGNISMEALPVTFTPEGT